MLSLIRHEWQLLLFAFLMTFWSAPGQTFFISLFSGEIRAELDLSDGEFGAIYSLATLLSAVVMVWSGTLVDKVDLKRFSISCVFGLSIGCVLMSISAGIISLFIGLFMMRQMGQGLMFITSTTAVVRYLDENKGKSTALAGMGYAVSEAIMPILVVALILSLGWSLAVWASLFLMYALISVATKFIAGFWVDRFGAIRLVYMAGLPMAIGLILLSLTSSIFWGGVFLALTGVTVGFQSTVSAPFWAEMYGSKHLGAIKSMGAALMVFCTAVSPFLFGWLIDLEVSIESLAMASAGYIFLASLLAYYACRMVVAERGFQS